MTAGREVVEDYGHTRPDAAQHPVSFLRARSEPRRIVTCAEAMQARDRRWLDPPAWFWCGSGRARPKA
jgi:error-prone DNA polymerase